MRRTKVVGRLRVGLIVAVVATATLVSDQAIATPPGQNGRIAYRLYFNAEQTRAAIFTIDPDGSNKQQVTHPRRGVLNLTPDWSPNGRWIAYVRAPADRVHPRIWKIHPDGTDPRRLSRSCNARIGCLIEDDPAWSPDGSHIAYSRVYKKSLGRGVDLIIVRADGTHVRHATDHRAGNFSDWSVQWSPNGRRLVFARTDNREGMNGRAAIFTVRPNGSDLRRITPWDDTCCGVAWPDWSPDGRWIVFTSPIYAADTDLWLVRPDGSDLHKLTDTTRIQWLSSSFSPDGTKIVTAHNGGIGSSGNPDVYVMNADGSEIQNITQSRKYDSGADWGTA